MYQLPVDFLRTYALHRLWYLPVFDKKRASADDNKSQDSGSHDESLDSDDSGYGCIPALSFVLSDNEPNYLHVIITALNKLQDPLKTSEQIKGILSAASRSTKS